MKVLWLSRHPMSTQQQVDLLKVVRHSYRFTPAFQPSAIQIITLNETLPVGKTEAFDTIKRLMDTHECEVLTGVFPAHIAADLAVRGYINTRPWVAFLPVAIPQFAEDGSPRGFAHSHWEDL